MTPFVSPPTILTRVLVSLSGFTELKEAEHAHRDAVGELEKMRDAMVKMEQERLEMVAEVEAQIERALASMQIEIHSDASEYSDYSRPSSRMSGPNAPGTPKTRSRKGSVNEKRLRSYGTESTLVDYNDDVRHHIADRSATVIEETEEEAEGDERRKLLGVDDVQDIPDEEDLTIVKRFSAEANRADKNHQDAMGAVDMGISEKSDKIAQKVMEIQRKVSSQTLSLGCGLIFLASSLKLLFPTSTGGLHPPVRAKIITLEPVARVVAGRPKATAPMARLLRTLLLRSTGRSPLHPSPSITTQPPSSWTPRPAIASPPLDPLEVTLLLKVFEGSAPVFPSARPLLLLH